MTSGNGSGPVSAPPADVAISVVGVSKRFRLFADRKTNLKESLTVRRRRNKFSDFWALKDVSFDIPRGKTFGLIGHNGSGKSTLLKLIAGIHRPTSGHIQSFGRISAMLELGAGFHPEMTGRENMYLNGSILGMTRKQIDASMDQIIEFSGLNEFIDTPVKVYSSGMFVRLGFAIAVNLDPEILIVDEVIAVGDEEFQRKCFDRLYELRRAGTTIVLVTHALGLVADLCDEVAWLDHGHLMATGPATQVIDKYMKAVNTKEAADAGTEETNDVATGTRTGSGEILIEGLTCVDADETEVPFLSSGRAATFRLHYRANEAAAEVTFGLGFAHESGVVVAGPNSGYGPDSFAVAAGTGHVDFHVERLPLQPGEFSVTTAAVSRGHTYDYRDKAFVLKVRADGAVTEPGLVRLEGSWRLSGGRGGAHLERDLAARGPAGPTGRL